MDSANESFPAAGPDGLTSPPTVADPASLTAEERRLREARAGVPWRAWGPYLSERQWGTVREDYSDSEDAWSYFTHDQARSRAYRWGEDGIAGIVVVSDPISSVTVLAVLLGIWFIVMGLFEVIAAFIIRRAASESRSAQQRFADEGAPTL